MTTGEELMAREEFQSLSSDQAKARIALLKSDATFLKKLQEPTVVGHQMALAAWLELRRIAYSEPTQG